MTDKRLVAAAVLAFAAGTLFQACKSRDSSPRTAPPAPPSPPPAVQASLTPPLEPLPAEWNCPAGPGKWFTPRQDEVIETEKRWKEYLKISGFKPPERVDFERYRVALFTFIGGSGSRLLRFEASRKDGGYTLTMVSSAREGGPGMAVTQDIVYDCRLFLVPRENGELSLGSRSVTDAAEQSSGLLMPLPYDPAETVGTLPDGADEPISLDKPVSIPDSGGSRKEKPVHPAKNAPPPL